MTTTLLIFFTALTAFYIGSATVMTKLIIDAIEEASTLTHTRVVYEDDQIGTLTVYPREAILELHDGTVLVIPRMEEAKIDEYSA